MDSCVLEHWGGGDDNGDVTEVCKCISKARYLKFKQFRGIMGTSTAHMLDLGYII